MKMGHSAWSGPHKRRKGKNARDVQGSHVGVSEPETRALQLAAQGSWQPREAHNGTRRGPAMKDFLSRFSEEVSLALLIQVQTSGLES